MVTAGVGSGELPNDLEGEIVAVVDALTVPETVFEVVAELDVVSVPEPDTVPVTVTVPLGVREGDVDEELVGLFEGEFDGVNVADKDAVEEIVALCDEEGVPLTEAPLLKVFVGVAVIVGETLAVIEPLSVSLGV